MNWMNKDWRIGGPFHNFPLEERKIPANKAEEQPFYTKAYILEWGERMRDVSIFLSATGVLNRILLTIEKLSYDFHVLCLSCESFTTLIYHNRSELLEFLGKDKISKLLHRTIQFRYFVNSVEGYLWSIEKSCWSIHQMLFQKTVSGGWLSPSEFCM